MTTPHYDLPRPVTATQARTKAAALALEAALTTDPLMRRELRRAAGRWTDRAVMAATLGGKEHKA